ncbi:MAG TPA: DUF177 domain-containing protein [Steroidobacteraceae bacterium]|nr:DUF177 domain-containing protein [Steroidobacteraceae bacterium]
MSEPWSRPLEVDRLADGEAEVGFTVPLAELPGLATKVTGSVAGRARFGRAQGLPTAELMVRGAATLECQRCMRPMSVPIDTVVRVALVSAEADIARVPPELEPVLAPGGRISIGGLIAEELLLTLPIVALHGEGEPCAAPPAEIAAGEPGQDTHKPFARLADLLKR